MSSSDESTMIRCRFFDGFATADVVAVRSGECFFDFATADVVAVRSGEFFFDFPAADVVAKLAP